jgi:hypothetical protein
MTLILSGTDGLSDVDGSAATPAIRGTDANTGIFFPAADTIAFSEGGVESMRIDASGNMGLGVTPSAWGSSKGLQVGTLTSLADISGASLFGCNYYYNGTNNIAIGTSAASRYYQTSGEHYWQTAGAGSAGRTLSFTTAMTLDASGNLGIGVTPSAWSNGKAIEVAAKGNGFWSFGSADSRLTCNMYYNGAFLYGTTNPAGQYAINGNIHSWSIAASGTAGNTISFTEAMRIDSSGTFLVGKTGATISTAGGYITTNGEAVFTVSANPVLYVNRLTDDGDLVRFYQASTQEGSISVSGTTVSYNGGHLSRWAQTTTAKDDSLVKGTVLSNLDAMNVYTDAQGNPVDNEQLNKVKVSDVEGDVNVAGVFVNWSHDEDHNVDEINMAMTGDMIIRIAQGTTVQRGDLLMSAGDGTAKPQGDDIVRSKTVAKVTSTHVTCTYPDGSFCVPCVLMAC